MNNNLNITEEELELIDNYLSGAVTADEKQLFEQRLQHDTGWSEKFNQVKLMSIGIQEAALKEKMQHWNINASTPVVRMWTFRKMAAACIILVGSAISWFLFKGSAEEKLYTAFYKADPGLATNMSVSDNYEFERAMVDYKTGNYTAALTRWNKLLTVNAGNDTLNYFIASAELANKNKEAAIVSFDKVINDSNSVFKSEAYWYKGLALLKQEKKQAAIQSIQQSHHPQKAALLLKLSK